MKRNDIILILILALIGGAFLFFEYRKNSADPGNAVRITVDGEEFGVYPLNTDQIIEIGSGNRCEIREGKAAMIWADCPDHICVNSAPVNRNGATIVCMPNRVILEIRSEIDDGIDMIAG